MNQNGFVQIALVIGILVIAGLVGTAYIAKDPPVNLPDKLPALIAQLKTKEAVNNEGSKTASLEEVKDPSKLIQDQDSVKVAGKYNFAADKKIEYEFTLPKNGGSINGKIGGVCDGKITGNAKQQSQDGKSRLQGTLDGNCQISPLPFKVKLEASFEGFADYRNNNVNVNYKVTQPVSTQSNLVIPFLKIIDDRQILPPQTQEKPNLPPYKVNVTPSQVNVSGIYKISDDGYVEYNFSVARQSGAITGTGSGSCNAAVSGQVGELSSNGRRQIKGTIKGACKPLVSLGNRTDLDGTFWGFLNDKKGEIEVVHNGIFQKDANGYFMINYNPKD